MNDAAITSGGPNSLASLDVARHLHSCTNLHQHEIDGPLIIDRGEGIYVFDDAGKRYIEGMSGLRCTTLGFSEKRLGQAAARQLDRLPFNHTFRGRSHDVTIELADRLITAAPRPLSKVFFASSGSEANDSAMKFAWYYNNALGRPRKRKIISRHKAYHGTTIATASLTGLEDYHRDFNLPMADIVYVACPHHYRYAQAGETEEAFATRLAKEVEDVILAEGPETVAAFIAEPVMGVGAVIVPPAGYFQKIQAVLRKYDVLMIADEVICGFGRTGQMFGSDTFGISPDIMTVAKGLSSAYLPISAVMVTEPIYRAFVEESKKIGIMAHGFTYSGHPVCSAVALEVMKIYAERDIIGNVQRVGARFQAGLRKFAASPIVGEVRGVGLMAAVELVADKATKTPFPREAKVGARLGERAQAKGLFIRPVGDSVMCAPPLIITEREVDTLLEIYGQALAETEAAVRAAA